MVEESLGLVLREHGFGWAHWEDFDTNLLRGSFLGLNGRRYTVSPDRDPDATEINCDGVFFFVQQSM